MQKQTCKRTKGWKRDINIPLFYYVWLHWIDGREEKRVRKGKGKRERGCLDVSKKKKKNERKKIFYSFIFVNYKLI